MANRIAAFYPRQPTPPDDDQGDGLLARVEILHEQGLTLLCTRPDGRDAIQAVIPRGCVVEVPREAAAGLARAGFATIL